MSVTVIVIGDDELDAERSSESVAADPSLAGARVVRRQSSDPSPWSGLESEALVFLRAGDRLLPGAGSVVLGGLADREIVVGAHRLAGRGGWDTDIVPPPLHTRSDLAEVAVDAPFELSAIGAKPGALPAFVSPAPAAPGGEVALLHALLQRGRFAVLHTAIAQVRMRPVHQGDPDGVLDRLRGVLHGPLGSDAAVAARVRRRALSVAYLESSAEVAARFRPDDWWQPEGAYLEPRRLLEILRDVHWAAARLAEARSIAVAGFDGVVANAPEDAWTVLPPDTNNLIVTNESLHRMVAELSATVQWLHAEVHVRDEQLAGTRRRGLPVEQTKSLELARELWRRTRWHVRRLTRRGASG